MQSFGRLWASGCHFIGPEQQARPWGDSMLIPARHLRHAHPESGLAAARHPPETQRALDSTYVRLNLSVAEQELSQPIPAESQRVTEVLDRLQTRLGRSR